MAKLIIVPKIEGLEGLLALVAEPRRVADHLEKLKEASDALNERLGDLDTHEKMQEALGRALAAEAEAGQAKRTANEALAKAQTEAATIIASASAKAEAAKTAADKHVQDVRDRENAISGREAAAKTKEESCIKRESDLSGRELTVAQREQSLQKREEALSAKARRVAEAVAG